MMASFIKLIAAPALVGLIAAFAVLYFNDRNTRQDDVTAITTPTETKLINDRVADPVIESKPSEPFSYADAVETAAPSVVNIYTTKIVESRVRQLFNDPEFRRFFGLENSPKRNRMESSLGSGVTVSSDGYVLTNNHVIQDAVEIYIAFKDGRESLAKVVGTDPETDLAVLKVDLGMLPAIELADSDTARVGDVVLAIGNPFGFGQTVTKGIISAKGRDLQLSTYEDFIQTDAAINPGNSGGALIDPYGRLVGINTAIFSKSGGPTGIGFAIPTNLVQSVLLDIIESGRVIRGWLGIRPDVSNLEANQRFGGQEKMRGVLIAALYRDGPADLAGLQPGDMIVALDDQAVEDAKDAMQYIADSQPGSKVKIKYIRQGATLITHVTLNERPGVP